MLICCVFAQNAKLSKAFNCAINGFFRNVLDFVIKGRYNIF